MELKNDLPTPFLTNLVQTYVLILKTPFINGKLMVLVKKIT